MERSAALATACTVALGCAVVLVLRFSACSELSRHLKAGCMVDAWHASGTTLLVLAACALLAILMLLDHPRS